ncbi:amino acid permease [Novosphingobium sp. FSW06-99]|uniref:amino acid permease n=1 Tax=Novosphingobium sp. FSW06-99 TaxID=1739113 RepID=UPI00076C0576|nr:amino acid permease [Novosphingobium sp. FSW06-99]KUR79505.1 hypothetical protein AQZ49_04830 [Novosphingobium sp. FSW06-99]
MRHLVNVGSVVIWPILLLTHDAAGHPVNGHWDAMGISIFMGGLFVAAWLLCVVVFTLVPISFQGVLGLNGMLAPNIADNMGVCKAMAGMIHAGLVVGNVIVLMMILALLLAIIMSMAGASHTFYQPSTDGRLPK